MRFTTVLAGALAATGVMAHPGHDHTREMLERREFLQNKPRDLSHCAEKLKRSGLERRAAERRAKRTLDLVAERSPGSLALKSKGERTPIFWVGLADETVPYRAPDRRLPRH